MSDSNRFICVHGHFYQPPRENPWLEAIELQESAAPFHDWNARITRECYAANGSSRILNAEGRIERIVNNYSRISFNIGPTLLAWMEHSAPLTYQRILDADKRSQDRFGGHGSAMAQAYNHIILPLAAKEDRVTQIRWGIADFEHRFRRRPEGMWLAETAADRESLDLLVQHGIRFTVLAPHQCARVRPLHPNGRPAGDWRATPYAGVDPRQPYWVRTGPGRRIAIFFYDGPISRAIAFEGLLNDGVTFASRLLQGFRGDDGSPQLVHVATDGESYGHHHPCGDMALAYALHWLERSGQATLTNYGEFLDRFPPQWEAEIVDNSSWSCFHGVERWRSDCGCNTGGAAGWSQQWRAPLRKSLDWLRDTARPLWRKAAAELQMEPAAARNAYIHVMLQGTPEAQQSFLERFVPGARTPAQQVRALQLMEMERNLQLMYTSCGWFFSDLAGIETLQILCYAARALELAAQSCGAKAAALEQEFLVHLAAAHANGPGHATGADLYRKHVVPRRVSLGRAMAQYALVSLFESQPDLTRQYCYEFRRQSENVLLSGRGRVALGQAQAASRITRESRAMEFAVVHLGEEHVSAAVRPQRGDDRAHTFTEFSGQMQEAVSRADLAAMMELLVRDFGGETYSLNSLFRDDRERILNRLLEPTRAGMEAALRHIYVDHASLLRYLNHSEMPCPPALRLAAEFTLNAALREALSVHPVNLEELRRLLREAEDNQISLNAPVLEHLASHRLLDAVLDVVREQDMPSLERAMALTETLHQLPFPADPWEAQNRWYRFSLEVAAHNEHDSAWRSAFLALGARLNLDVEHLTVDA